MSSLKLIAFSKSAKPGNSAALEAASSDFTGAVLFAYYRIFDREAVIGVMVGV